MPQTPRRDARLGPVLTGLVLLVGAWLWTTTRGPPSQSGGEALRVVAAPPAGAAGRGGDPRPRAASAGAGPSQRRAPQAAGSTDAPDARALASARVAVRVQVQDSDGERVPGARVISADCGVSVVADARGEADARVAPGRCSFRAARQDGLLYTRGPWVTVEVAPPGPATLDLGLAAERAGGLGVQVEPEDAGMVVVAVHPGTPAAAAGVGPGDVIIEVDGHDAAELTIEQFLVHMAGPEGSTLDLTLQGAADTGAPARALSIERVFLPRSLIEGDGGG